MGAVASIEKVQLYINSFCSGPVLRWHIKKKYWIAQEQPR